MLTAPELTLILLPMLPSFVWTRPLVGPCARRAPVLLRSSHASDDGTERQLGLDQFSLGLPSMLPRQRESGPRLELQPGHSLHGTGLAGVGWRV